MSLCCFQHDVSISLLGQALNKDGCNSLHVAAMRGQTASCGALLSALPLKMAKSLVSKPDRRGVTAIEMAKSRGHQALHDALSEFSLSGILPSALQLSSAASSGQDLLSSERLTTIRPGRYCDCTLILAPEECLLHHTAPHPLRRGANPPPENEDRLRVLTNEATGILRCTEFKSLMWETQGLPSCTMSDILRCHDWSYVQSIMQACMEILDHPLDVGHLDSDTAISHHSYLAALKAAGAVCAGVDRVMSEQARNVFCAVRPPGHHAGPSGKCTNDNDPHGSHGFCLFSNVAIGAAYAMNVYRHQGVKKVALLDFDVHHGNGTEAVVANTFPSVQKVAFTTPYSEGVQKFPMYKPWLDSQDEENIFFASVQGYGHRSASLGRDGGWFYPGSGCTADTKPPSLGATAAPDDSRAASAASQDTQFVHQVKEDPDGEFTGSTADQGGRKGQGPRIINVGVPGPGSKRQMWRRAWRDKILPALFNFQPDLIIVSAGFDAHKKEDLNLRYVGVTEQDYEWLTMQIVEMANRFCKGRIVSVLEGGYNLRGGLVSAFARSVAAHVRALADGSKRLWDPSDSEKEREMEARAKLKQLSSLQQNIEVGGKLRAADTFVTKVDTLNGSSSSPCLAPALPVVSATTASVHNDVSSDQNAEMASGGTDKAVLGGGVISAGNDAPCKEVERMQGGKSRMEDEQTRLAASHLEAAHYAKKRDMSGFAEAAPSPADAGSSKRSRRGQPVDYVALNAELEAETGASK
ncbi:hypothetical protein CEUSTIGMA_g13043.t1 [Chlamydomonas eustigma]|uniref:Histone deacetylase domain-containing protein n=1 Tax=Chlamydomonas eustigma TaxID=1157962 RepID=A0A250XRD4_9CHLO|nr:hypothetical protein CEUSTIGMA_g13043.t1 [Chlamydomonas eustigma]|eukprot:GAX85628.1 hypothetical protein CEUSTIGMA_g13043.t1 [Chlamydomonas eustigma]